MTGIKQSMYKLKVGIDMHVVGGIYQGSRTYMIEIFSRVITDCPEIQFYIFCGDAKTLLSIADSFSLSNVVVVPGISKNAIYRIAVQLPLVQKRYELDYLHVQYILPLFLYSKGVVALHDILFESYPEFFSKLFVLRSKCLIRWSARRASTIFTISTFSKDEIINRYGIPKDKINLVYCGVDTSRFYPGADGHDRLTDRGLVSGGYILSVGRIDPRKNLVSLIHAYDRTSKTVPLVIVGQDGLSAHEVYDTIIYLGLSQRVIIISDAGDDELAAIYRHARIFVFPTFSEGFGLPILEAMASGVPVVTSNTTSLPEVAGEAAVLVDPYSIGEISDAIASLMRSTELQVSLAKKGIAQAQKFNWLSSATLVAQFYLSKAKEEHDGHA